MLGPLGCVCLCQGPCSASPSCPDFKSPKDRVLLIFKRRSTRSSAEHGAQEGPTACSYRAPNSHVPPNGSFKESLLHPEICHFLPSALKLPPSEEVSVSGMTASAGGYGFQLRVHFLNKHSPCCVGTGSSATSLHPSPIRK